MEFEAIEAQLRAHPDDLSGWLVLADWLLEQSDPRGELIVIEHRLTTQLLPTAERHALSKRAAALQAAHQGEWLSGLSLPAGTYGRWQFGFLIEVTLPWRDGVLDAIGGWRQHRTARFLSGLDLGSCNLGDDDARTLAEAEALRGFGTLKLDHNRIGEDGVAALSCSENLRELVALDLSRNNLGSRGAAALFAAGELRSLSALDLGDNPIGPEGAEALAASELLRGLRRLRLYNARIGLRGVEALASVSGPVRLEELNLMRNDFGNRGLQALARAPGLRGLRSLDLRGNDLQLNAGLADTLLRSEALAGLTSLDLRDNPRTEQAARDSLIAAFSVRGGRCYA